MTKLDRRTTLKLLAAGTGTMAVGGPRALSHAATPRADAVPPATTDRTLSERIADYIVRARFADLSAAAIHKAKEQIVFFLGRAFETSSTEHVTQMRRALSSPSDHAETATVIGDGRRVAISDATFANAMLFGGLLSSADVLACADMHAGVLTLPTALALGEAKRVSGRDLILALVLGYEVLGKLNRAAPHWTGPLPCLSTNIFSGFGPVTVAGRLLGLDHERMTHAVSAGAHLGLSIAENPMIHYYYSQIARSGTFATQRIEAGAICYSRTVLDGEHGLYCSLLEGGPGQLVKVIDRLGYEEILTAAQQRDHRGSRNPTAMELFAAKVGKARLMPERAWQDWLAARGRRLLSREQLGQLLNLISCLEEVDDVSRLVAAATP